MIPEARIFLADQRGLSQTDDVQSWHSFQFGTYRPEGREPFGPLALLNDDTLRPDRRLSLTVETPTGVVLLPMVGGLGFSADGESGFLEAGQAQVLALPTGYTYEVNNPYETEFINFLQIWLQNPNGQPLPKTQTVDFDLNRPNVLLPFFDLPQLATGLIGRYEGRYNDTYRPTGNGAFVMVLSGAFEVQNRLLHPRDGLALTQLRADQVEFEALSNNALLIVLDMRL